MLNANQAIEKLKEGNARFMTQSHSEGDISPERRKDLLEQGQNPFAIVITCSDSRVVPESIFNCGLGELFVIRVAGNVIDNHQLGSIEYASDHLGAHLVVVLGHTHCGAVESAIHHEPDGYIQFITDEIKKAIGSEQDSYKASCLNVQNSLDKIESSLKIQTEEHEHGLKVIGAIYHLEDGHVEFLD